METSKLTASHLVIARVHRKRVLNYGPVVMYAESHTLGFQNLTNEIVAGT